ncbi:O-antigen ligase family protein [Tibeticola sp.]|uniref:O-antigen ligase family protein n=1 Tax=Tibeticola sp. TaxID=2005368 RepID=UPI0025FA3C9F|nr:O-antigen ligase family protein [Tibeticola sp.]
MARKKPRKPDATGTPAALPGDAPPTPPTPASPSTATTSARRAPSASPLPVPRPLADGGAVAVLAATLVLAPGLGVPSEEMLQDTLKSMIVSFGVLTAAVLFFWAQRQRTEPLRWHALLWLPLALMLWALGSMAWSHAYLGGVEAIRWFVLALLAWLVLQTADAERVERLAWGVHGGALLASFWTALQFWGDFALFPQGPNPASTFVNRNFFAEFAVCTLPFSLLLLLRARQTPVLALLAFTTAFNLVAVLMTGTRSALLALLLLALLLPVAAWRLRATLRAAVAQWSRSSRLLVPALFAVTVLALGVIPTGNAKLLEEHRLEQRGTTPFARALARSASMTERAEYTERSFSMRWSMWQATARMVAAHPFAGVGAGAWEVQIPRYLPAGSQLETDYYAHNEPLQLLAEYGLTGALFLLALLGYALNAAWRTWRLAASDAAAAEAAPCALVLIALAMFLLVSNAGFPWRLASTGALFALMLGLLAASDARLGWAPCRGWCGVRAVPWNAVRSRLALAALALALALAAYISQQAAEAERKIVRAVKIALTITQSGAYNDPRWDSYKREMLQNLREGIAINPHYRKITPMAADEMARWGDWKDATWVWESVLASRPYVVALLANVARGYAQMGQLDKAVVLLMRARDVQPDAPSLNSLEVILLSRSGREGEAYYLAKRLVEQGSYDFDLLNGAYVLGGRAQDWPLALRALELRTQGWPQYAVDGHLKSGDIWAAANPVHDEAKALAAYRAALAAAPPEQKDAVRAHIPEPYRSRL